MVLVVTQVGQNHCPGAWRATLDTHPNIHGTGANAVEAIGNLVAVLHTGIGIERIDLQPLRGAAEEGKS